MAMKRFKPKKTDVIRNGVVYRLLEAESEYGVYTYTADLPEKVVIESEVSGTPVTVLMENCFSGSSLSEISLPDSLRKFERGSFRECKNLTELKVPDYVYELGRASFKNCKNLKRLELGKHTKVADWNLCEGCKSIEEFIVWDELEYIAPNLFWNGGKKLNHSEYSYGLYLGNPDNPYVILNKNVRIDEPRKGEKVVVEIHPDTRFVTGGAFNRFCDGSVSFADLDEVILHDKILKIENGAFSLSFMGFEGVKTVRADSLESLCRAGGRLLEGSERLIVDGQEITQRLVLPSSVQGIGDNTFSYCKWLKEVVFEGNEITIGNHAFYNCVNLTKIKFPPKITEICYDAFKGCDSLGNVELYEVGEISSGAFENNKRKGYGIKSITFHGKVEKICRDAFKGNASLEQVIGFENVVEIVPIHGETPDVFAETPFAGKYN